MVTFPRLSLPLIPAVALPTSKNQLVKLGKRLAARDPAPGDEELYVAFLDAYDQVQTALVTVLRSVQWPVALPELTIVGRTKTLDTLVDKLRREHGIQLPNVRDVAGVRIVGELTLLQQTVLGSLLHGAYGGELIDRRARPTAGYRALHLACTVGGLPVEIQIRTQLQHLWAEVFERLADHWGRQVRYGGAPDHPADDVPVSFEGVPFDLRVQTIVSLQELSVTSLAEVERQLNEAQAVEAASVAPEQSGVWERVVRERLEQKNNPAAIRAAHEQLAARLEVIHGVRRRAEEMLLDLVTALDRNGPPDVDAGIVEKS